MGQRWTGKALMQHFSAYSVWQTQCYLLFFSSLQYLEFISLHMGLSGKGDCVI